MRCSREGSAGRKKPRRTIGGRSRCAPTMWTPISIWRARVCSSRVSPRKRPACYERGIAVAPRSARLHFSLASVHTDCGRLDEAVAGFRRALAIQPDHAEAYNGLAAALFALARPRGGAILCANSRVDVSKPNFHQAKFGCALAKLMQGDYAEGFALFEARFEKILALAEPASAALLERLNRLRGVPRWRGEHVAGKALLVWTDQGFGDTLMFMRYLRLLKGRGFARVIVQCEPPLARLLRADPGVDEVVLQEARAPFGDFDLHCPMSSLPLAFGTRLGSIRSAMRYVSVPDAMKEQWARRLAGVGPLRVGLIWGGQARFPQGRAAQYPLAALRAAARGQRRRFRQLAKGRRSCAKGRQRLDDPRLHGRMRRSARHCGAH